MQYGIITGAVEPWLSSATVNPVQGKIKIQDESYSGAFALQWSWKVPEV